jgi:Arc/MetJ family transcription regulator
MQTLYNTRLHSCGKHDKAESKQAISTARANRLVIKTASQQRHSDAHACTFDSPRSIVCSSPTAAGRDALVTICQERDALQAVITTLQWRSTRPTVAIDDQTQLAASLAREAKAVQCADAAEQQLAKEQAMHQMCRWQLARQKTDALQRLDTAQQQLAQIEADHRASLMKLSEREADAVQRVEDAEVKLAKLVADYNAVAVVRSPPGLSPSMPAECAWPASC